jgi:steroid delta-isomerase-like uncharacterized protein
MSDNKSVVRRYLEEVISQGKADAIDEVCAEDYIEYDPAWPGGKATRDQIKRAIPMYKRAFPDMLCTVEDVIAEGEKVAVYWRFSCTNLGELRGQPPTGKHGEVDVLTLMRVRDGKAVEARSCYDLSALRQQLGITTTAETAVPA